jgi:hypothetical protein
MAKSDKKSTSASEPSSYKSKKHELIDAELDDDLDEGAEELEGGITTRGGVIAASDWFGIAKKVFNAIDELKQQLNFKKYVDESQTATRGTVSHTAGRPIDEPVGMENIIGFGTGFKKINGFETPEECVKVYVRRKVTEAEIEEAAIPTEIGGVPTDVEVLPPTELRGLPYQCGHGIAFPTSHNKWMVGTAGCLCARDNKPLILTNNHVAADFDRRKSDINSGGKGEGLYQYPDGKLIGHLYDFAPLLRPYVDVDAALVHTKKGYFESKHRPSSYKMKAEMGTLQRGDEVVKDGWKTAFTKARFAGVITDLVVALPGMNVRHRLAYVFEGYFSTGGDSGAIIVRADDYKPVALLWGGPEGNPNITYASPIETVKSVMKIDYFLGAGDF